MFNHNRLAHCELVFSSCLNLMPLSITLLLALYSFKSNFKFLHFRVEQMEARSYVDLLESLDMLIYNITYRGNTKQEAQLLLGWPTVLPYSRRLCKSCGAFMQIGPAVFS